jgi:hypothetical protein
MALAPSPGSGSAGFLPLGDRRDSSRLSHNRGPSGRVGSIPAWRPSTSTRTAPTPTSTTSTSATTSTPRPRNAARWAAGPAPSGSAGQPRHALAVRPPGRPNGLDPGPGPVGRGHAHKAQTRVGRTIIVRPTPPRNALIFFGLFGLSAFRRGRESPRQPTSGRGPRRTPRARGAGRAGRRSAGRRGRGGRVARARI